MYYLYKSQNWMYVKSVILKITLTYYNVWKSAKYFQKKTILKVIPRDRYTCRWSKNTYFIIFESLETGNSNSCTRRLNNVTLDYLDTILESFLGRLVFHFFILECFVMWWEIILYFLVSILFNCAISFSRYSYLCFFSVFILLVLLVFLFSFQLFILLVTEVAKYKIK